MPGLGELLIWLQTSKLADVVGGPLYPLFSAAHILSFAFLIVPVMLADLRVLRTGGVDGTSVALSRIALLGFCVAALTGFLLFMVQAVRYAGNPAMTVKLSLILLAGLNAAAFYGLKERRRVMAALSIGFWAAILLAGRWIAFIG